MLLYFTLVIARGDVKGVPPHRCLRQSKIPAFRMVNQT